MKKKPSKAVEDYPHDRLTISVRKGYKQWIQRQCLESNLDVSKLVRFALEDWIEAHYHKFSSSQKQAIDALRAGYGKGHWGDLL